MTRKEYLQFAEKEFSDILKLIEKKNADYCGKSGDPFNNFKNVETFGICSVETGILTRLTDKFARTASLLHQENQVQGEGMRDSLVDIIGYSVLLLGYLESKKETSLPALEKQYAAKAVDEKQEEEF